MNLIVKSRDRNEFRQRAGKILIQKDDRYKHKTGIKHIYAGHITIPKPLGRWRVKYRLHF